LTYERENNRRLEGVVWWRSTSYCSYSSSNTISTIKSIGMREVGHVAWHSLYVSNEWDILVWKPPLEQITLET
jgi:hypothetical protein